MPGGVQDRNGEPRDTDELAALVTHPNFPDMRGSAKMNRACHAIDEAVPSRPQVVGIDLQTDAMMFSRIDTERCRPGPECFG